MPLPEIDVIATKILFDNKDAILAIQSWLATLDKAGDKTIFFKNLIQATAKQMNGDLSAATAAVQKLSNALNINPANIKRIGAELKLFDGIAQKTLGGLSAKASDSQGRIILLSNAIQAMALKGKTSIESVVASLRTLNASSNNKFGKLGFSDASIVQAGENAKKTAAAIGDVGKNSQIAGEQTKNGFERAVTGVNALRIAMGVLVSMLIFQVIQAFSNTFRSAISSLRETELAIYNIINAERRLSEQGIEITPKGLDETIEKIQKLVPILSRIQAQELVSRVATNVAPALKFTNEQIAQMSESVALLYVRNKALGYSFDEIEKAITDAFLTGKVSQGINKFGVKINDQIVKDEALRLGLVKTSEEFNNLTGEMEAQIKASAMLSVIYNNASQDVQSLGGYMNTTDAQIGKISASWTNLLTKLAEIGAPVIIESAKRLAYVLEVILDFLDKNEQKLKRFTALFLTINNLPAIISFGADPRDVFKSILDSYKDLEEEMDTPTGKPEAYKSAENNEDALKSLDELDEKLRDIALDAKQANQDLNIKAGQKIADLDTEYNRKRDDAARDHAQKLEDINRDALQKIEDAKRKAREDERKAEQDLLQKLKELRQRFLMDLEDALHARDARQILRLIKEYNFEKQNILDRKKLDDKQRKEKLAEDLKSIEIERKQRIEQAKIEYKRKLEDLALAEKRERDELLLWYQREQEDIARNTEQKLQKLLDGYIQEKKLREEQLGEIEKMLGTHFGNQMGMIDNLVAYMKTRFAEMSSMSIAAPATGGYAPLPPSFYQNAPLTGSFIGGGGQNYLTPSGASGTPKPSTKDARPVIKKGRIPAFADGGTLFARKPTLAMFGEKTPEFARFVPASKMGKSGMMGDMGVNGEIGMEILLSPDLEARVVKNAMNGTAAIVTKIRRTK